MGFEILVQGKLDDLLGMFLFRFRLSENAREIRVGAVVGGRREIENFREKVVHFNVLELLDCVRGLETRALGQKDASHVGVDGVPTV